MLRLTLAAALAATACALPTIYSKGSKFYTSDGNQFYLKGIAYQLTNDDPLVDAEQCSTDVALMKTLGTNSIRVYHVDAQANHDACMSTFADAGIYVFLDLDTFDTYILPDGQAPRWTSTQYSAFAAVMDTFHGYDNVGGFFIGNEMLNVAANSVAAPYLKAAASDMKAYQSSKGYRNIPIGYSATDSPTLRPMLQNYLACGDNPANAIDFYGINSYEWCDVSSFDASGYSAREAEAANYSIPIFFSETGCIIPESVPRTFQDQTAILGPDMDSTFSGAIIYEWVQEANDYGIITYAAPGGVSGTPTPIQPEFDNLKNVWQTLNPVGTPAAQYKPSLPAPACPAATNGGWLINGNVPLPTLALNAVTQIPTTAQPAQSTAAPPPSSAAATASTAPTTSSSTSGVAAASSSSVSKGASSTTASMSSVAAASSSTSQSSVASTSSSSSSSLGTSATGSSTGSATSGLTTVAPQTSSSTTTDSRVDGTSSASSSTTTPGSGAASYSWASNESIALSLVALLASLF